VVTSAITKINEFQFKYNKLQSNFKNSIANLNNLSNKLTTPVDYNITISFEDESLTFDKSSILKQFGKLSLAQANAKPPTVMKLLKY
jgi:flagellin-like hook-associated protein FlgL